MKRQGIPSTSMNRAPGPPSSSSSSSSSSQSFSSKKRSLLGYDDPDAEQLLQTTQDQLKAQNEAKISQLLVGKENENVFL